MKRLNVIFAAALCLCACDQGSKYPSPPTRTTPESTLDSDIQVFRKIDLKGLPGNVQLDVLHRKITRHSEKGAPDRERFLIAVYQFGVFQFGLDVNATNRQVKVERLNQIPKIPANIKIEQESYETRFSQVGEYVILRHRFETARCRSSKYWAQIKNQKPGQRGNFLLSLGRSLYSRSQDIETLVSVAPNGKVIDFAVVQGLEIGGDLLKLKYVSLDEIPQIKYGTGGRAIQDFYIFSGYCSEAYQSRYRNTTFSSPWLPLYSTAEVDQAASEILDYELKKFTVNPVFQSGIHGYASYLAEDIPQLITQFPYVHNPKHQLPTFE